MTQQRKRQSETKMVPVPSHSIVPERDVNKRPVLETRHLGVDFGGLRAVEDFNLTIGQTEIAGLIGPNGAGKTTVFNLLTKVYQPTTGVVILDGKDTAGMNAVQANKLGIASVCPPTGSRRRSSTRRRWSFCPSSTCRTWRATARGPCPTARREGLRSCAPWPRTPSSFCSTSPPPA